MGKSAPALKGNIGRFQLFAFGFGSIIGSSWCVLVGSWLAAAGPGGAVLGFIAGGIVVACIGACYAELTSRIPVTGGEFSFVLHMFGRGPAFYVGWFIALAWICIAIFEGLAVAWLFERLGTGVADVPLYDAFGTTVTRNQLVIGVAGACLIAAINYTGGQTLARFHSLLTYTFISVAMTLVVLMLGHGDPANLTRLAPFLPARDPVWWQGAASIFAQCAFLLCGFQAISQVVEEKSERIAFGAVFRILVATIGAAAIFYCLVVLATGIMMPWPSLPPHSLAFVEGTRLLPFGRALVVLVLVIAMLSLVKTWNGVFLMAARTLIALGRSELLPGWMNRWHGRTGVPAPVVLVIFALNLVGLLFGRGAVGMLVDTITISLVLGYAICCIGLPMLRRRDGKTAIAAPGAVVAVGVAGSVIMAVLAVLMPMLQAGGLPTVYLVYPLWALIGAAAYGTMRKARANL